MYKYVYHASRVIFGGWWLYSGAMHFIDPAWQPMGHEPAAIAFTQALMDSGLFFWVKVLEVVLGITILANRAMPLTLVWNWAFVRGYLRLEHPIAVATSNTVLAVLLSLLATFLAFGWI